MRTDEINTALQKSLTPERLEKYLVASGGNLHQALSLYERNARLAESFYTPLQSLEVCLRNALHRELTAVYGPKWYLPHAAPLFADSMDEIGEALGKLGEAGKPVTPGQVVAELKFWFWVSLLGPRYDANLWRKALFRAFKENGATPKRDRVHRRFNAIRRFRNRVAHHEPIFLNNLPGTHSEIIEAMSWMCSDTAAWAFFNSRFNTVYAAP